MGIFENKEVKFIYFQLHNQSINSVLENAVRKITREKLNILWVQFPLQMLAFCLCLPLGFFACSLLLFYYCCYCYYCIYMHICMCSICECGHVYAMARVGVRGQLYEVYSFFLPQCRFQESNAGQQVCAAGPFALVVFCFQTVSTV